MIKEVSGDILLSGAEVIAHGLAPGDHFTSGLALSLREEWPAMVKDFRHYCHLENPDAGGLWLWSGPGRRVANLFTQTPARQEGGHPGKATVENVNHALRALHRLLDEDETLLLLFTEAVRAERAMHDHLLAQLVALKKLRKLRGRSLGERARNLIDVAVAAAFIQKQDYYGQAGWKAEVLLDDISVIVMVPVSIVEP